MIGIDRAIVQGPVARGAFLRRAGKSISRMTLFTARRRMRAGQWEPGKPRMVESSRKIRIFPLIHPVAAFATHAEARSSVVDRPRRVVLRQMTRSTRRAESCEYRSCSAVMTGFAGRGGMCARQRKPIQMLPNRG